MLRAKGYRPAPCTDRRTTDTVEAAPAWGGLDWNFAGSTLDNSVAPRDTAGEPCNLYFRTAAWAAAVLRHGRSPTRTAYKCHTCCEVGVRIQTERSFVLRTRNSVKMCAGPPLENLRCGK